MAEKKQILSQDVKLPVGVSLTPGHMVDVSDAPHKRQVSDRRVNHLGEVEDIGDAEHLSTYPYEKQPVAPVAQARLPRESVNEANASSSKK